MSFVIPTVTPLYQYIFHATSFSSVHKCPQPASMAGRHPTPPFLLSTMHGLQYYYWKFIRNISLPPLSNSFCPFQPNIVIVVPSLIYLHSSPLPAPHTVVSFPPWTNHCPHFYYLCIPALFNVQLIYISFHPIDSNTFPVLSFYYLVHRCLINILMNVRTHLL